MRRLAARLVPRFLQLFPQSLGEVVGMLVGLHQARWGMRSHTFMLTLFCQKSNNTAPPLSPFPLRYRTSDHDVDSVIAATKTDVLRGLGNCLDAASKMDPEAVIPSVQSIVDFLLR